MNTQFHFLAVSASPWGYFLLPEEHIQFPSSILTSFCLALDDALDFTCLQVYSFICIVNNSLEACSILITSHFPLAFKNIFSISSDLHDACWEITCLSSSYSFEINVFNKKKKKSPLFLVIKCWIAKSWLLLYLLSWGRNKEFFYWLVYSLPPQLINIINAEMYSICHIVS